MSERFQNLNTLSLELKDRFDSLSQADFLHPRDLAAVALKDISYLQSLHLEGIISNEVAAKIYNQSAQFFARVSQPEIAIKLMILAQQTASS